MTKEEFKAKLEATIDAKYAGIMSKKKPEHAYLTFIDASTLTATVKNLFKNKIQIAPPQIEAACTLSEALLAPSAKERENLIKAAVGIAGGTAGIAMIIAGIGAALGWGAGVVAAVVVFFVGAPVAGPIGWISAGVAIAAIAGYFALTGSPAKNTERFMKALKRSVQDAVDPVWEEYGEVLGRDE
jgi:hypothetical protein